MTMDPDDEALRWDGHADSTHTESTQGDSPVADAAGAPTRDASAVSAASSILLVIYGVFGGIYLLFTVGWFVAVLRDDFTSGTLFFEIMYQLGELLAIASPAMWMLTSLVLTRESKPFVRLLVLFLGLLVVAPWPFIVSGGATHA
ncbi:MAG: hypothetical protein JWP30_2004 [Homoserinimonas sp.]|jgi:hypothetical protein|nr:hypothetical protein [Homoserinimonas sp.]